MKLVGFEPTMDPLCSPAGYFTDSNRQSGAPVRMPFRHNFSKFNYLHILQFYLVPYYVNYAILILIYFLFE